MITLLHPNTLSLLEIAIAIQIIPINYPTYAGYVDLFFYKWQTNEVFYCGVGLVLEITGKRGIIPESTINPVREMVWK
jgi:hypothetical protein